MFCFITDKQEIDSSQNLCKKNYDLLKVAVYVSSDKNAKVKVTQKN